MTVNLAIIGIGRIGKIHANSIFTHPNAKLVGFFDENKFSKNCKSMYSNSMGMACITKEQLEHLDQHGGNRTMGDE